MTRTLEPSPRILSRRVVRAQLRLAAAAVVIGVAAAGGWHYWTLVSSLREGKAELLAARASLTALNIDVSPADLNTAGRRSARADVALTRADAHFSRDPLIKVASWLPGIGPQVDATGELIRAGRASADIATEATAAAEEFVAIRDGDGRDEPVAVTLVRGIEATRPRLERIQFLTAQLIEHRLAIGDAALLPPLASARDTLDEELPGLAESAANLARGYEVLPGLLGFEGERRYLVLALNNGELLPGGGLVSAAGIVTVSSGDAGGVDFTDSTRWKSQWEAMGGAYVPPPGPLQRHLLRDYTWNLLVSNWDPDFPTWSQQALEFYELVHGEQHVDGVIALDLEVLRRLLAITGPRTIEVDGHGSLTFTPENAILQLEGVTRQSFEPAEDRKSVIGDLAFALLDEIGALPRSEWGTLAAALRELAAGGHVQVISFDANEQALVRDAGWHGALEPGAGDYLHFNEASVNSTKLNLIVQPEATYSIDVSALGDARHKLALRYHNPLPEWRQGKDPKLVQQLMLGGVYGGYLRVFAPASVSAWSAEDAAGGLGIEGTGEGHGLRWFGVFMRLPAGHSASPTLRWTVPLATRAPGASHYEVLIQKQAGTTGMCIDLTVTREGEPASWLMIEGGRRDAAGRICLTTDVRIRAAWE